MLKIILKKLKIILLRIIRMIIIKIISLKYFGVQLNKKNYQIKNGILKLRKIPIKLLKKCPNLVN